MARIFDDAPRFQGARHYIHDAQAAAQLDVREGVVLYLSWTDLRGVVPKVLGSGRREEMPVVPNATEETFVLTLEQATKLRNELTVAMLECQRHSL